MLTRTLAAPAHRHTNERAWLLGGRVGPTGQNSKNLAAHSRVGTVWPCMARADDAAAGCASDAHVSAPAVFVSEDAYVALSATTRWLHRIPAAGATPGPSRDDGAASVPQDTQRIPAATRGHAAPHSSLSWEEHAWYLRVSQPDAAARLPAAELERLLRMSETVAAEQAVYAAERASTGAGADSLRFLRPDVSAQARHLNQASGRACLPNAAAAESKRSLGAGGSSARRASAACFAAAGAV